MKLCACGCGRPIPENGKGRPGKYASSNCRVNAFRQRQDVTKVAGPVTKCNEPALTAQQGEIEHSIEAGRASDVTKVHQDVTKSRLQAELLEIGRLMGYEPLVLGAVDPEKAIVIRPGSSAWASYATAIRDVSRLQEVIFFARRYLGHLQSVGLAKPAPVTKIQDGVTKVPDAPKCSTIDGLAFREFCHIPNTSEPGGYDVVGNYWCANCTPKLEAMNAAARLGWPEISYFPQNTGGPEMRAVMIGEGMAEWQKRLPTFHNNYNHHSWHNIRYQLQRLEREQATKEPLEKEEKHVNLNVSSGL